MGEQLVSLGLVIIFVGIILVIVGSLVSPKSKDKVGFAFGGFIGPIPFGFANRAGLLKFVIAASVIILIVFLLLGRKL